MWGGGVILFIFCNFLSTVKSGPRVAVLVSKNGPSSLDPSYLWSELSSILNILLDSNSTYFGGQFNFRMYH